LNDSQRVIFREGGDLYLFDRRGGTPQQIHSLKGSRDIGTHLISRDNRQIYFTDVSNEADIWLLSLK